MSAELVEIVDARDSIEAMPQDAREMLIASNLEQADSWLRAALAVPSPDPRSIADYKVQIAAVEQMARQLRLSKDTQLHATELVRRAERGVGVAIRKGQTAGTVETPSESRSRAGRIARGSYQVGNTNLIRPLEIAPMHELIGATGHDGIYAMTDNVTDEQFGAAIEEAKDEGNLSRANVIRKVKGIQSGETRDQRARRVANLAAEGHSSRQIAPLVGIGEPALAAIIRDYGIDVPADQLVKNTKRIKSADVVDNVIGTIEAATFSLSHVNPSEVQGEQIDSLIQSINALRKAANKIKESHQ